MKPHEPDARCLGPGGGDACGTACAAGALDGRLDQLRRLRGVRPDLGGFGAAFGLRSYILLMRTLSASRLETYLMVKLPSAAPYVFAWLDMGAVYALLGTIVAEFLGTQAGLGVTITQLQSVSDVAGVFACLIVLGVTGIVLHLGMRAVERRVVHWTERSRS